MQLPRAPNQYSPVSPKVGYAINDVGDPTTITDARGNSFTNSFYDTGELKSTGRPSWWLWAREAGNGTATPEAPAPPTQDGTEIRERTPEEMWRDLGQKPDLPESEGYGDFGKVDPAASRADPLRVRR